MTTDKCGSKDCAQAELDRSLISSRRFPRFQVPLGKETAHYKLMADVIISRSQRRCKGLGCSLPVAITAETQKAVDKTRELWPDDVPKVGAQVMKRLEAKGRDAKQQSNVISDKVEKIKTDLAKQRRRW